MIYGIGALEYIVLCYVYTLKVQGPLGIYIYIYICRSRDYKDHRDEIWDWGELGFKVHGLGFRVQGFRASEFRSAGFRT